MTLRLSEVVYTTSQLYSPQTNYWYILSPQGHMQWVFDHTGRRYLDLFGGIVTVSVGHCHPWAITSRTPPTHTHTPHTDIHTPTQHTHTDRFGACSDNYVILKLILWKNNNAVYLKLSSVYTCKPPSPGKWVPVSRTRWTSCGTWPTSTCILVSMTTQRSLPQSSLEISRYGTVMALR